MYVTHPLGLVRRGPVTGRPVRLGIPGRGPLVDRFELATLTLTTPVGSATEPLLVRIPTHRSASVCGDERDAFPERSGVGTHRHVTLVFTDIATHDTIFDGAALRGRFPGFSVTTYAEGLEIIRRERESNSARSGR